MRCKTKACRRCFIRHGHACDEVVIDYWLHVERMNKRNWFAAVGDMALWIKVDRHGHGTVTMTEKRPNPPPKRKR